MSTKIVDFLLRLVFERIPILSWLNGHKTNLGRAIKFIIALAALVHLHFPELPIPDLQALLAGYFGAGVLQFIGEAHADAKERTGVF